MATFDDSERNWYKLIVLWSVEIVTIQGLFGGCFIYYLTSDIWCALGTFSMILVLSPLLRFTVGGVFFVGTVEEVVTDWTWWPWLSYGCAVVANLGVPFAVLSYIPTESTWWLLGTLGGVLMILPCALVVVLIWGIYDGWREERSTTKQLARSLLDSIDSGNEIPSRQYYIQKTGENVSEVILGKHENPVDENISNSPTIPKNH